MQIVSSWAEGQEIALDALRIPSVGVQAVADCLVCVNMGEDKQLLKLNWSLVGIIEPFELEEAFKGRLIQLPCNE